MGSVHVDHKEVHGRDRCNGVFKVEKEGSWKKRCRHICHHCLKKVESCKDQYMYQKLTSCSIDTVYYYHGILHGLRLFILHGLRLSFILHGLRLFYFPELFILLRRRRFHLNTFHCS